MRFLVYVFASVRKIPHLCQAVLPSLLLFTLAGCQDHHSQHNTNLPVTSSPLAGVFVDMRPTSGISFTIPHPRRPLNILQTLGHGAALLDFDNDGLLDILLIGADQVHLYHNKGNWQFTDVTAASGLRQKGCWQGAAAGDYDNDGRQDLYLCGYNCSALYHNEGNGHFKEMTLQAGVQVSPPDRQGAPEWRTSAAFIDVNQDGLLDLYVCQYVRFGPHTIQLCRTSGGPEACPPEFYDPQRGHLYINLGQGRFRDETTKRGLESSAGRGLGIAAADYDGDGWIDLAVANDEKPGDLFHNKGQGYFENVGPTSGTAFSSDGNVHGGMGVDWGDWENSGRPGLLIATYQNEVKNLFSNLGHGMFLDMSERAGLSRTTRQQVAFGARFFDYDNDGYLDIALANGHTMDNAGSSYAQVPRLFHNAGSGAFEDMDKQAGAAFQTPIVGRALCVGDIDNDGRLDLLITNLEGEPLLLRNNTAHPGHWLEIELVGTRSNREGIGARVTLAAGSLHQVRTATATGSFMSASDPRIHFGLGASTRIDALEVRWPSGHLDTWHNIPIDSRVAFTENQAGFKRR